MKKTIVLLLCLVMLLFSLSACSDNRFLSQKKVDRLMEKYAPNGELPRMEMTLAYKTSKSETDIKVKVVYELLLDKTPQTVIGFINLLNSGRYNNVLVDSVNTSGKYLNIGQLTATDIADKDTYSFIKTDSTIIGEFKNNQCPIYGQGDYPTIETFSLAMYHENWLTMSDEKAQQEEYKRAYDSADGRLMLYYSASNEHINYAVFARPISFSIAYGDGEFSTPTSLLLPDVIDNIKAINTSSTSITVEGSSFKQLQISVSFAMLGNYDWTQIKDNYLNVDISKQTEN